MTKKNADTADTSSMDQVRDLLMGTHLKDIETRMQRQEKALLREIANMRDNFQNRVQSLENFMKNEFTSIMRHLQEEKNERSSNYKNEQKDRIESIKTEQEERIEALKEEKQEREKAFSRLTQNLSANAEDQERKFISISSSLDSAEKGLRELMLSENARISNTIDEKYQELIDNLTTTASQIRNDLVSRSAISSMFAEAAVRFSGQSTETIEESKESLVEPKGNNES